MSEKELKDQETENLQDPQENPENQEENTQAAADTESGEQQNDETELESIKKELGELKDQNLRLYAEFENFRKRTSRERMELYSTANRELMEALLPVLDDFKRALKAGDDDSATGSEGTKLIYSKLENTLKNKGLKTMEDSTGKEFDVDTMEAITRIPAPEDKLKGKVVDEVERGYLLGEKILRYAKVVVGE